MIYSYVDDYGNGVTVEYNISFPYIKKSHVTVEVDGVPTAFTWVSSTRVSLASAPVMGALVRRKRTTPKDPIITWLDGGVDRAEYRNTANKQAIYLAQENFDYDSKAMHLSYGEDIDDAKLTLPEDRAGMLLGFDSYKIPVSVPHPTIGVDTGIVFVDEYGAVGDGVTDDTIAVQAAISLANPGDTIKFNGSKTYFLRSLGTISKSLSIDGCGAKIICDVTPSGTSGTPLFGFSGSFGVYSTALTVAAGSKTITLSTPSEYTKFSPGGFVTIACDDPVPIWDGSGTGYTGYFETHRVVASDVSGVITLAEPIDNPMSVSVRIRTVAMVTAPSVKNFSSISEIDPGGMAPSSSGAITEPSLIVFYGCEYPLAENIRIDGWNLIAVASAYSYGTVARGIRGYDAFRPTSGGHGVVFKCVSSRQALAEHCYSFSARHCVDWVYASDCQSQYCHATHDDVDVDIFGFVTHGIASHRIRSFMDSATNGHGWSIGNPTFAADYDVEIFGFNWNSPSTTLGVGISVYCKTDNVKIRNCRLTGLAPINISRGAGNVLVDGCELTSSDSAGYGIHAYLGGGSVYPYNITLKDNTVTATGASGTGIYVDATGPIDICNNMVSAYYGIRAMNALAPSLLRCNNNIVYGINTPVVGINLGDNGSVYYPTGEFEVQGNKLSGGASAFGIGVNASTKLLLRDNRSDATTKIQLRRLSVLQVITGGGKVENNGWPSDLASAKDSFNLDVPAATDAGYFISIAGTPTWRLTATAAGNLQFEYWSGGAYNNNPFSMASGSGSINFNRAQTIFGYSSLGSTQTCECRSSAGVNCGFLFTSGSTARWLMRKSTDAETGSDAGSNYELIARHDDGTLIDSPIKVIRAANGAITLSRPIVMQSAWTVKVTSVVSAAGTTVVGVTDHTIVTTGTTTHTYTLPTASTGRTLTFKNRSTGTVTINRAGSDTIDGATSYSLLAGKAITITSNSTDWCVVSGF